MRIEALRIVQPSGREVFSFAATADVLLQITEIPHIARGGDDQLIGYQRPEVISHIGEIRRYLESEGAVLPNTIVVAFNNSVTFTPRPVNVGAAEFGELHIPLAGKGEPRPGFVVDGQQRLAAIASSCHAAFPFFVTALIAPDVAEQRKQFVLVNRTKPLPQGMIYELLPEIEGCLPQSLAKQRMAAMLTTRLNLTPGSILQHKIRTPTCPKGIIKDNSMRRTILNSLSDGALFGVLRDKRSDPDLMDVMTKVVATFWQGVRQTFPDAWDLPPKSSRLTHGVGIVALGYVMDDLYLRCLEGAEWTAESVAEGLVVLVPHCAWTGGKWHFSNEERAWNALQNTDRDVRLLASYLRRLLPASRGSVAVSP
jgi:DGQHR domain-containing protein